MTEQRPSLARDPRAERDVRAVAVLQALAGLAVAALSTWGAAVSWAMLHEKPHGGPMAIDVRPLVGCLVASVGMVYSAVALVLGFFLWRFSLGARVLVVSLWVVLTVAQLGSAPLLRSMIPDVEVLLASGTVALWGAASCWALLRPGASALFTDAYRRAARSDARASSSWITSLCLWAPLVVAVPTACLVCWNVAGRKRAEEEQARARDEAYARGAHAADQLPLPLNPFASAEPGDWCELCITSHDMQAAEVFRHEVTTIEGDVVTVHSTKKDVHACLEQDLGAKSFSRSRAPLWKEVFYGFEKIESSRTEAGVRTVGGRDFACSTLTVRVSDSLLTSVCFSAEVKSLGIVCASSGEGDTTEVRAFGTRARELWRAPVPPEPDRLPWSPVESAATGDWASYTVTHTDGGAGETPKALTLVVDHGTGDTVQVLFHGEKCPWLAASSSISFGLLKSEAPTWRGFSRSPAPWTGPVQSLGARDETLTIGGRAFACKRLSFKRDGNPVDVWLSRDVKGVGVVAVSLAQGTVTHRFELVGYGSRDGATWGKGPG